MAAWLGMHKHSLCSVKPDTAPVPMAVMGQGSSHGFVGIAGNFVYETVTKCLEQVGLHQLLGEACRLMRKTQTAVPLKDNPACTSTPTCPHRCIGTWEDRLFHFL